ncbi:MAG TPA: hypothetical protein VKZ53_08185 [Candidatus Angelobacter sp.]|nr:hypothetical protein [Candidatus Angelobacter sp.]
MKTSARILNAWRFALFAAAVWMAPASHAIPQDSQATQQETTQAGPANQEIQVRTGEVVYVSGNDLVVKSQDGQLRHFVVPEETKFNINGQDVSVHDLKPGMKLTRTIVTTTTPTVVKNVQTIQGVVWQVNPPTKIILTLASGENKEYTIPEGTKFNIDGRDTSVADLRKGMRVSATVVTETPQTEVSHETAISGSAPPTPPVVGVLLIERVPVETPAPAPTVTHEPETTAAAEPPPQPEPEHHEAAPAVEHHAKKLPQTASPLPLAGLLGLGSLFTGLALRKKR